MMRTSRRSAFRFLSRTNLNTQKYIEELKSLEEKYKKELQETANMIREYMKQIFQAKAGVRIQYNIISEFTFKNGVITLKCPNCRANLNPQTLKQEK